MTTTTPPNRSYDLVLFGATGFTGGKTAEYLARNAPPELRWALAGRNPDALEAVRQRLTAIDARCATLPLVRASVEDAASLERMAAETRVVLTTVGPFVDYGEPVVRACVAHGTDYLDSTGEPAFIAILLERYAAAAAERGVRLVPSCGYDSIPADLGAFFTMRELPPDRPIRLAGYLAAHAYLSGGTQRSAIKALAHVERAREIEVGSQRQGARVRIAKAVIARKPELGGFVAPLPTVDAEVVTRSAAALDCYGPDFSYAHYGVVGSFAQLAISAFFVALGLFIARFAFGRALMLGLAERPGRGPSEAQMARSWFKLRFVAECDQRVVQTEVSGGDPGYGETSKMLAESGMCLALDRAALPLRSGLLTPATAMGDLLLARLQRAGLSFRVL